jgi:hypothetical protein
MATKTIRIEGIPAADLVAWFAARGVQLDIVPAPAGEEAEDGADGD